MKEAAVKDYLLYEQYNYITVVNYYTVLNIIQSMTLIDAAFASEYKAKGVFFLGH